MCGKKKNKSENWRYNFWKKKIEIGKIEALKENFRNIILKKLKSCERENDKNK